MVKDTFSNEYFLVLDFRPSDFIQRFDYFVLRRSFSELYQKAIKETECKPGEDRSGEAWVLDDREDQEKDAQPEKDDELKMSEVSEEETIDMQPEEERAEGEPCQEGQSEEGQGSLLTPPGLPLLRVTSLQDPPANQSQEGISPLLPRSLSLERQLDYTDECDG